MVRIEQRSPGPESESGTPSVGGPHSRGLPRLFQGHLEFAGASEFWRRLDKRCRKVARGATYDFDLSSVESIDGGTAAILVHLRNRLRKRHVHSDFVGAREGVQELLHLYGADEPPPRRLRQVRKHLLDELGEQTMGVVNATKQTLAFLGDVIVALVGWVKHPATGNWKEVPYLMERNGADAVPIVVLINFLVGFVMAFQGAVQLKQFGANIYVADLVGLSITRELGPLMTAIIVCGRSGAAFAAELGTMRVSEEIDALRTLGFGPIRYLVLPRTLALILVVPILTVLADLVGMFGGLLVGVFSLDISVRAYIVETQEAVKLWDITSGVLKSVVFATAIALISCQRGFATSGGAQGVGRSTTSSVVTSLFVLILLDAIFTVLFHFTDL
jgi:phospholipid/cholesterol/gamma-HCH transport system permease protein